MTLPGSKLPQAVSAKSCRVLRTWRAGQQITSKPSYQVTKLAPQGYQPAVAARHRQMQVFQMADFAPGELLTPNGSCAIHGPCLAAVLLTNRIIEDGLSGSPRQPVASAAVAACRRIISEFPESKSPIANCLTTRLLMGFASSFETSSSKALAVPTRVAAPTRFH